MEEQQEEPVFVGYFDMNLGKKKQNKSSQPILAIGLYRVFLFVKGKCTVNVHQLELERISSTTHENLQLVFKPQADGNRVTIGIDSINCSKKYLLEGTANPDHINEIILSIVRSFDFRLSC